MDVSCKSRLGQPSTNGLLIALTLAALLALGVAGAQAQANFYWNGGSISANPAAGGTGTWDTANAWRTVSDTGSQGTWVAATGGTNNGFLAGNAGTITLGSSGSANFTGGNLTVSTTGYAITSASGNRNLVFAGTLTLADNVALTFDQNNTGATWGFGAFTFGTGSSLTLQGIATASNANRVNLSSVGTISGGSITLAGTAAGPTGFVATANGVTLNTNIANSSGTSATMLGATMGNLLTYGGVLSGSANLQISAGQSGGAGIVVLTGVNTFTGDTYLNATTNGVTRIGVANALPSGTTVFFGQSAGGGTSDNGGSLDLNGLNLAIGALDGGSATRGVANNTTNLATLTIGRASGSNTFAGVIGTVTNSNLPTQTNSIALVKTGASTQVLTGVNTFSGDTKVNGGILTLGNNLALQNSALDTSGSGAVTLTVTTPTFGGLKGSTNLASVLTTGYGSVTSLTLNPGTGASNTYSGVIANGSMSLTKTGAGTQVLGGANTYTGGTTLSAGILQIGVPSVGSVGSITSSAVGTGTLALNGGTLSSDGATARTILNAVTVGGSVNLGDATNNGLLTFSAAINLGGATRSITTPSDVVFGGVVSNGGLTKAGVGTLTLSAGNTYGGATTVSGGVLRLNDADALPGGTGSSGGTSNLSLAGSGVIGLGAGDFTRGIGTGTEQVQWTGAGGFAAYGADRTVNLGGASALITWNNATASGGLGSNTLVLGSATATHKVTWVNPLDMANGSSYTVRVNRGAAAIDAEISGVISGASTARTLNLNGGGTIYLSALNTYTGPTSIGADTTVVINTSKNGSSASSIGTGGGTGASQLVLANNATLRYIGTGDSSNRGFTFNGSATLDASGSGTWTLSPASSVAINNTGDRTYTLAGTGAGVLSGSFVFTNPSGGVANVTKSGSGTWTNANQYSASGVFTFAGGVYIVTNNTSVANGGTNSGIGAGSADASHLVFNGGTFRFATTTGSAQNTDRLFTLGVNGGTIEASSSVATNVLSFTNAGDIAFSAADTSQTLTLGGTNVGSATVFNTLAPRLTDNGTGVTSLTKNGAGSWRMTNANTYSGTTTVSAGTLRAGVVSVADTSGAFGNNSAVAMANVAGAILEITGFNTQIGSLTGGGATGGNVTLGAATLTVGGDNTNPAAYAGIISGTGGSLVKIGAGTLTLSGASPYTGATTISAGRLSIASTGTINSTSGVSIGAGEFNYNSSTALSKAITFSGTGGRLSGTGTITPAVNVTSGNTLAPGNSIGTLTFGGGLAIAGTYSAELGTPGGSPAAGLSDLAVVTGSLTLTGGNLTLVDNAGASSQGSAGAGAYRLITFTGTRTGTFSTVTNPLSATLHESIVYNGASNGTVDLNLYRLATANTITSTVNLGNARVGGTLDLAVTVTNTASNDGFSEGLNATTGALTGNATASGSVSNLAGGASSTAITVGVSTSTAGAKTGGVQINLASNGSGTSGYGTTVLDGQAIAVNGAVYNPAAAAASQTVTLNNVRVGAPASASLTLTNTAPADATYTETLGTTGFSGTTSGYTATGSATGIAGGNSGSGNLSVGVGAGTITTAGTFSGSTTLGLQTQAVNGSGLGTLGIGNQTVTINGAAYDYARAAYIGVTLAFGAVHEGATVGSQSVAFGNQTVTNASYQDLLDVAASTGNSKVTATGFTGLGASTGGTTTNNLTFSVDTSSPGSLASTAALTLTSNANGVSGLSNGTASVAGSPGAITTTGQVYSGQSAWNTDGSGSWGTLANGFGTNWGTNQGSPGLDSGFADTDTATFGAAAAAGPATVTLDGASPSLKAITFDNATHAYTLAQGSSGTVTLNNGGGDAMLTVSNGSHTISAPMTLASNLDAAVTNAADTLAIFGGIGESGGSKALTKSGAGNLTLSGSNTYSGATTVTGGTLEVNGSIGSTTSVSLTEGTLLLGASNAINSAASITFNGGTLNTGGFSQFNGSGDGTGADGAGAGLGALILSGDSTLDFASGAQSILWFASVGALTGGTTLSITNWMGGGNDQLRFTADPSAILGHINFTGRGATQIFFQNDGGASYYEIVPIPEPAHAALIGAALLLGLIGFRERRRLREH